MTMETDEHFTILTGEKGRIRLRNGFTCADLYTVFRIRIRIVSVFGSRIRIRIQEGKNGPPKAETTANKKVAVKKAIPAKKVVAKKTTTKVSASTKKAVKTAPRKPIAKKTAAKKKK